MIMRKRRPRLQASYSFNLSLSLSLARPQSSFKETYMYDFYKLFQEDKCIEKVKQVHDWNLSPILGPLTFRKGSMVGGRGLT